MMSKQRLTLTGLITLSSVCAAQSQVPAGHFVNVGNVPMRSLNTAENEAAPELSADGKTLYFSRPGEFGGFDLFEAELPTNDSPSGRIMNLGAGVNSSAWETMSKISSDGLTLYFHSNRGGGVGGSDIYKATRATKSDMFDNAVNLGDEINSSADDLPGHLAQDGLTLYFMSNRNGGHGGWDLYKATRDNENDSFGQVTNLGDGVNTAWDEFSLWVSADGLTMFFAEYWNATSFRPGGEGGADIWVATRESTDQPFGNVVNVNDFSLGSSINSPQNDFGITISQDWPASGSTLYFGTFNRPDGFGQNDILQATWETEEPEVELEIHNAVLLRWQATEKDFTVLQAPSVDGPWEPTSEPVIEMEGYQQTTIPTENGFEFFQLMEPEPNQP